MHLSSSPEKQIEIDALAGALRELPVEGIVSYEMLSEIVGFRIQSHRFALFKAREVVEKESGVRFATVTGVGVKKLPADALAAIGALARKRIARAAKRQSARLTGLRYNDIHPATQAQIDAERSLLGAIAATARTDVKSIAIETSTGPIVASKVFGLMEK